ncbi:phosphotransferase enzyme family protein [Ceratobasidium sp. AG-Ba]|nr:phosphotransferase enzyme family protein [Ceratobasidium sp. AG-Ba]
MAFEYEALTTIARSELVTPESVVQVPRVLLYDPSAYVLILEDLAPALPLSSVLLEAFQNGTIESKSMKIGAALGDFIGRLHSWSALPEQASMRERFSQNVASKESIPRVWYGEMIKSAKQYGLYMPWMDEFAEQRMRDAQAGGNVVIMGDFWVENILVSPGPEFHLYVIDWEMARCANPEVDVGYFAGALHSISYINRRLVELPLHGELYPKLQPTFFG